MNKTQLLITRLPKDCFGHIDWYGQDGKAVSVEEVLTIGELKGNLRSILKGEFGEFAGRIEEMRLEYPFLTEVHQARFDKVSRRIERYKF